MMDNIFEVEFVTIPKILLLSIYTNDILIFLRDLYKKILRFHCEMFLQG